jgi:hypothetical protein
MPSFIDAAPWVTAMQGKSEGVIVLVSSAAGVQGCTNALAYGVGQWSFLQSTPPIMPPQDVRRAD